MIVLEILLSSLCAVYFIRLLSKKNMRVAAVTVAILYVYIVAWIYIILALDIADLGFSDTETKIALLHGSDIYHSFVHLTNTMSGISLPLLESIVAVSGLILFASIAVVFHGLFEITKAFIRAAKEKNDNVTSGIKQYRFKYLAGLIKSASILRLNCRMNC